MITVSKIKMKKLLLLTLLLPIFIQGQVVNTFPWIHNFDNNVGLEQDTNDFGDWLLHQGTTSSFNTGPSGDHTTGNGIYFYVESSGQNYGGKVFTIYTPTFDISQTPGKVLSFWYHMYGAAMGDLEIGVLDSVGYTALDTISGDQGNNWKLAYYPIITNTPFKIKFKAITGSSYTSDISIDDVMISDPYTVIYGCTDTVSSNYDSTATHDNGTCIYIAGCIDPSALNSALYGNLQQYLPSGFGQTYGLGSAVPTGPGTANPEGYGEEVGGGTGYVNGGIVSLYGKS